jgi:RimJ/RimL family protein N-acetyltransferase
MADVQIHRSIAQFQNIVDRLYRRDPVLFTAELTALESASPSADNIFLSAWDGLHFLGAVVRISPHAVLASGLPAAAAPEAARILAQAGYQTASISGLTANAVAFADAWRAVTKANAKVVLEEQLLRLGTLHPPTGVAGAARPANRNDLPVLTDWFDQFHVEAFGAAADPDRQRDFVDRILRSGSHVVVWIAEGTPVSMARLHPIVASMVRIGPVFTPPAKRGQGFGSAVTAAAAHHARLAGAEHVVLFTDLANPVSNKIYQQIGFEPVARAVEITVT